MIIREFRIPMPMTLSEYQVAQLYTTMEMSKLETGGGDGIEEISNEPFLDHDMGCFGIQSGQYTLKKIYLDHKVPTFVRILMPKGSLHLQEESWNAFPYCRTVLTNEYLNERLIITIESIHLPDRGNTENALNLSPEKLSQREVVFVDIACNSHGLDEEANSADCRMDQYVSGKTGRGPLEPNWFVDHRPVMTCYKLVTIEVKIFGLQSRLESYILNSQKRIFLAFHSLLTNLRRMFICMDHWHGLTMEDIRRLEKATTQELEQQRKFGELRGTRAED